MRVVPLLFCLVQTVFSLESAIGSVNKPWENYKRTYKLSFSPTEDQEREKIFLENLKAIEEYNARNTGVTLAVNEFAHKRYSEINPMFKMKVTRKARGVTESTVSELPVKKRVDWREYKVVTRVKDQGQCGSCYAFSAVGAMESMFALKTGRLQELSEQEIVDCSAGGDEGCNGGYPESVFNYSIQYGLSTESEYEYTAAKDACHTKNKNHSHKLRSYVEIEQGNEHELVRALSFQGPISIALDANHLEFMFYHSGILSIDSCSKTDLDHAVLAVGYNLDSKPPYIIVKNSWSERWGENGYFRMVLFKNMCGIASMAAYPVVQV